jgi:hypothetical protein
MRVVSRSQGIEIDYAKLRRGEYTWRTLFQAMQSMTAMAQNLFKLLGKYNVDHLVLRTGKYGPFHMGRPKTVADAS